MKKYEPMTASGYIDDGLVAIFNSRDNHATEKKELVKVQTRIVPPDTIFAPAKGKPTTYEILAKCTYIAFHHAGIEMLLLYWGARGMMDYTTSWGASVVVAVICGFRIGWTFKTNK